MLTESEIKKFIADDLASTKKRLAGIGQRYYEGEHDILKNRLFYFNADGNLVEDKTRSNVKISHPFFTELTEQISAYMLSFDENPIRAKETAESETAAELQEQLDLYFDDEFWAPHSRHTTIRREDIEAIPGLKILASSEEAGVYIVMNKEGRQIFVTGHSEYDPDTLEKEYLRDKNQGLPIAVPKNYYPNDDDTKRPLITWRGHATLLFTNWLNYFVYQTTPYEINKISEQ